MVLAEILSADIALEISDVPVGPVGAMIKGKWL